MFKKGDKVYSILRGWGTVECDYGDSEYSLFVRFETTNQRYTKDGKYFMRDPHPELYHTEPVITVPKRRVEHTGWIAISNTREVNKRYVSSIYDESFSETHLENYTVQQITYYTEE